MQGGRWQGAGVFADVTCSVDWCQSRPSMFSVRHRCLTNRPLSLCCKCCKAGRSGGEFVLLSLEEEAEGCKLINSRHINKARGAATASLINSATHFLNRFDPWIVTFIAPAMAVLLSLLQHLHLVMTRHFSPFRAQLWGGGVHPSALSTVLT